MKKPEWAGRTPTWATSPHSKGAHDGPWGWIVLFVRGDTRARPAKQGDGPTSLPLDCEKSSLQIREIK